MAEMVLLYPWMIRQAHQDGKDVYVWFGVIENSVMMRLMLAMGADGLMVDDPVTLAEIYGRLIFIAILVGAFLIGVKNKDSINW